MCRHTKKSCADYPTLVVECLDQGLIFFTDADAQAGYAFVIAQEKTRLAISGVAKEKAFNAQIAQFTQAV